MEISLGTIVGSGRIKKIKLPRNITTTPNHNSLIIATPGSGKTNLMMLEISLMYKTYLDSNGRFGCLPIVFTPLYEFMQLELPSKNVNMPPEVTPYGIDCVHVTFPICNPIRHDKLRVHAFDFSEMDESTLLGFTDFADDDKYLGAVKKLLWRMQNGYWLGSGKNKEWVKPVDFTLENFIEAVREDSSLYDALYHVFTELQKAEMFDTKKYKPLDLRAIILEKKPIIFHFGDMDDRQRMAGMAGIILKQLWDISGEYYSAAVLESGSQRMSDFQRFLVKYWTVGLFVDEAHQILYATKSSGLALESKHPAHYWFKKIIALMGRKRGFKYSRVITQKFMEIFYGIRLTFDELVVGQTIYPDDKNFLKDDLHIEPDHIAAMTRIPKYCWTHLNISRYQKRQKKCAYRLRAYLSPSGQPK